MHKIVSGLFISLDGVYESPHEWHFPYWSDEMGAVVQDVAFSIHPHPTLSETEAEAAEIFLGSATHVPPFRK